MDKNKTEQLGDLIYTTLKEDEVTASIGERAYITDILSEAIIKAGYVKLADDQSLPRILTIAGDEFSRNQIIRAMDAMKKAHWVKIIPSKNTDKFLDAEGES